MYQSLNAYGQVTRESYANGVTTTRAFDANSGRLTGIDTAMGATKLQDNDYAWQSNGILRSRVSHVGGTAARSETFSYDVLDRLKTATATLTGHPAGRTLSMSYDRLGNLKTRTSSVSGDTDVTAYVYGSGGTGQPSLTTLRTVSIGGVSHTLTHDSSGRVTKYDGPGSDRYLGWNGRHLPTTVTVGDSLADATPKAKDELLYGPDGARYYKKSTWEVTDATTMTTSYPVEHTFYAGTHREVIRVGDAANSSVATSSVTATVLHIRTTPVSGSPTTSFEYLHRDHLGSVESVTDGTGAELKVQAYDPFGSRRADDWTRAMTDAERTALAGEAPRRTARGYTGHEHLERTGLIHMNGRVYDPAIGRFLSPDPIVADASFSQSWNAYSYALNSPLSYSDPSGFSVAKTTTVYGDRYWDSASLSMLESLLWSSFYHSHQLPLYFNEFYDAQSWNDGVHPAFATVPLQGAVSLGEEIGPADRPMAQRLDSLQTGLDVAGLSPVVGIAADLVNAAISIVRGKFIDAGLNIGAAIPVIGQGITGAKIVHRASTGLAGSAADRAKQVHSVLDPRAERARTTAVTETREGIRVVSSSERRLTPAQRATLGVNEIEGVGVGHAEITGVHAARKLGLTPTGTAASRPICVNCATSLAEEAVQVLSPLK